MRTVTVQIRGIAPLSWGKRVRAEKLENEDDAGYEQRNWREKFHRTDDGHLLIPSQAFKRALESAAKYKNKKVPGEGQARYTKFFEAGIIVPDNLVLEATVDDLRSQWLFLPSNGRVGGGTRVDKCFPVLEGDWGGEVTFLVIETKITKEVFTEFLVAAGEIKGIGFWRPETRGANGRFTVDSVDWGEMEK